MLTVYRRGLAASRADEQEQGAEERQLQEALRSSRLDQADVSTASEAEEETASEIEIEKGKLARQPIEKPQLKRKAEHHLTNPREKAGRRLEPPALSTSSMRYSGGAIRITRTPGRQQAGNCVNLEDIIDKRSLVSACVFSFYIGDQELFRHLPLSRSTNSVPVSDRDPSTYEPELMDNPDLHRPRC